MVNTIEEIQKTLHHYGDISPILGFELNASNTCLLDLSESNQQLTAEVFSSAPSFQAYIDQCLEKSGAKIGIGGYLEDRMIYRRSDHFGTAGEEPRSIHLGVDLWAPALTPVFLPVEGTIHSTQDNAGWGNYGPTIIVEHHIGPVTFFTLYGHLDRSSLSKWKTGDRVEKGALLAQFGQEEENGNWPPHLHFQVMNDLLGWKGDFPGVCKPSEKAKYMKICPDPRLLIR